MRTLGIIFTIPFIYMSCNISDDRANQLIENETLFIAGFIEATNLRLYPTEVYVAYLSNDDIPSLGKPIFQPGFKSRFLSRNIAEFLSAFRFSPRNEPNATVLIEGPLNHPNNSTVELSYTENGRYADSNNLLLAIPLQSYRLTVTLPDGRSYGSVTNIPGAAILQTPEVIEAELTLRCSDTADGIACNERSEFFVIPSIDGKGATITLGSLNMSDDARIFLEDGFNNNPWGNFLRGGSVKYVATNSLNQGEVFGEGGRFELFSFWSGSSDHPLSFEEQIWVWNYQVPDDFLNWFSTTPTIEVSGKKGDTTFFYYRNRPLEAVMRGNKEFLFEITNLRRVNESGNIAEENHRDVMGIFMGYAATYDSTTVIPIRSWDPDTLDWARE